MRHENQQRDHSRAVHTMKGKWTSVLLCSVLGSSCRICSPNQNTPLLLHAFETLKISILEISVCNCRCCVGDCGDRLKQRNYCLRNCIDWVQLFVRVSGDEWKYLYMKCLRSNTACQDIQYVFFYLTKSGKSYPCIKSHKSGCSVDTIYKQTVYCLHWNR